MVLIDIEKCYECGRCTVQCSVPLHHHKTGFPAILEKAIREITCRHCEDAPCVEACPTGALIKEEDGLKRSSMLCTSCKTCLIACPFGVNTLETVEFKTSPCDLCEGREILCVKTCGKGAVSSGNFKENSEAGICKIADGVFAKGVYWKKQIGLARKR